MIYIGRGAVKMMTSKHRLDFPHLVGGQSTWRPPKTHVRRRTLFDLSPMTHCSIIGTCLTMAELRRIVVKIAGESARKMNDHDIHTAGVRYASTDGLPTKLITKALDEKHASVVRKLSTAEDEAFLRECWANARRDGMVEGAYWAIATHPLASEAFFNEVFGDVHMLSHLVGASNRADIKKLILLTSEKERLSEDLTSAQRQIRDGWSRRDRELQVLRQMLAERSSPFDDHGGMDERDVINALKKTIAQLEKRLQARSARIRSLERMADDLRHERDAIMHDLIKARGVNQALLGDLAEMERSPDDPDHPLPDLQGRAVLYVGGVSKGVRFVRSAVERTGAGFLPHDGGQEQATVLLRGLVSRADVVLLALDFVSHDAALICKNLCVQQQKPFMPLPHAGVGSVMRALREYAAA
jgi:hypothetical protein